MTRKIAATGGTFDIIHRGHRSLLDAALQYDSAIIGLCSDEFVRKRGKDTLHDYDTRFYNLDGFICEHFPGKEFQIHPLDDTFGPAVLQADVGILVTSEETYHTGDILNKMRISRGLPPVDVVSVQMVSGSDGTRISTTKIRDNVMDTNGNKILSSS